MPSGLDRAVSSLAATIKRAAGTAVKIYRGARTSSTIYGVLTVSVHEVYDEETGIPTKQKSSDWVFSKSDLSIAGSVIFLRPGDLIKTVETNEEDVRTFKVGPIAGRPTTEPHDSKGVMVICHSEEVTCLRLC